MFNYDNYNREERALCVHLFRLLHEQLYNKQSSPLGQLINKLASRNLTFKNGGGNLATLHYDNIGLFCEVAIIRDAYQNTKPTINPFMDDLTRLVMKQEGVSDCRLYSQLPEVLRDPKVTHPKQIRHKASAEGVRLSEAEGKVYGALQGMFNAKPDLVITVDNKLLAFEAKFTEAFDEQQIKRTWNIAEVWTTLLYKDFGFAEQPEYTVIKLGAASSSPHINWTDILDIAKHTYVENDRTRIAITAGVDFLKRTLLE